MVQSQKEPTGPPEQARSDSGQEKLPCEKKLRADPDYDWVWRERPRESEIKGLADRP